MRVLKSMTGGLVVLGMMLGVLAMAIDASADGPRPVAIVAHRGASHDAPENTLAAINLAWEQGADAVEIDVYLSADGHVVAAHDATTKRTAGVDRMVAEQTLAELKTLDVGRWKDPRFAGERIPTLEEILKTVPDGRRMFIEVKCGPEIVEALRRVCLESGKSPWQTTVISFNLEVVREVKKTMPGVPAYWVMSVTPRAADPNEPKNVPLAQQIPAAKEAGADGLDVNWKSGIDADYLATVRRAGLELHAWTVNDAEQARTLAAVGIDSITTDRPGWLREQLGIGVD
ncbi:MAG: glycerophosphodiester phosphodiesterase [Patescibacteria group bacterium]|nr:glycerophosphodiester phosphodiesterase [Patescibacteria group bacterium]